MADLVVRGARSDDLPVIGALLAELHDEPPAPAPLLEATLARILGTSDRHLVVVEHGGEVVGMADGVVVANLSRGCRPFMLVENVVVLARARRLGAGRALLRYLVAVGEGSGCYKIQLLSNRARHEAHAFYESLGFDACAQGYRRYLDAVPVLGRNGDVGRG